MKANSEADINQAFQVRKIVFVDEQHVSIEEEMDAFDKEAIHFIGVKKDQPIAASRLRFVDNYGKLERICIIKPERGKSYGKLMIKEMEKEILTQGYTKTKLNAQTQAIPFYEQQGYKVVSGEFLDAGIPHVTMTKKLI